MGTARLHAENQAASAQQTAVRERRHKQRDLEQQIDTTEARFRELTRDRARLQDALQAEKDAAAEADLQTAQQSASIIAKRGSARLPDGQTFSDASQTGDDG